MSYISVPDAIVWSVAHLPVSLASRKSIGISSLCAASYIPGQFSRSQRTFGSVYASCMRLPVSVNMSRVPKARSREAACSPARTSSQLSALHSGRKSASTGTTVMPCELTETPRISAAGSPEAAIASFAVSSVSAHHRFASCSAHFSRGVKSPYSLYEFPTSRSFASYSMLLHPVVPRSIARYNGIVPPPFPLIGRICTLPRRSARRRPPS